MLAIAQAILTGDGVAWIGFGLRWNRIVRSIKEQGHELYSCIRYELLFIWWWSHLFKISKLELESPLFRCLMINDPGWVSGQEPRMGPGLLTILKPRLCLLVCTCARAPMIHLPIYSAMFYVTPPCSKYKLKLKFLPHNPLCQSKNSGICPQHT